MSESKLSSFLLPSSQQVIKVIPVQDLNLLLVQAVIPGKAESTLYALQLPTVKELWQLPLHIDLAGWPSLQFVVKDKACFTCFPDPTLPATEGAYIYDLKKKQWIVKEKDWSLIRREGEHLLFRKAGDEEQYHILNLTSLKDTVFEPLKTIQLTKQTIEGILYPYHIGEENPLYKDLTDFVKEKAAHSLVGMVEYLEWKDERIVVSYYIVGAKDWDQYLLITDKEGNTVLHERIDEQLKGMALDIFMLVKEQCVYVKNKNQLQVYDLS